ncbi:MAG TPA: serine hydrolase domain-containing protein [Actinomycetota bacterium]|nr:serine hydrolase domain-containing protein [Actinomycetota bacterium]
MTDIATVAREHARAKRFSGAVLVERARDTLVRQAFGFADRRHRTPNQIDTRFGIASGTKGFTALSVVSLVEDGTLEMSTTARSLLGEDLPLIRDDVTIEDLLAHRSGIGDYYDEEVVIDPTEYVLPVPVQELVNTEDYLKVLDGFPTKFPPGERFSYCNSGYVVLALLAERAAGVPFADLVRQRVCDPAEMNRTEFLRSDELPSDAAIGYLSHESERTNLFHLPVRGSGDGGIYTTLDDMHSFWRALFSGRIVSRERVKEMTSPRSEVPGENKRYGLGFWLHASGATVYLWGGDAGVSFGSACDPDQDITYTAVSNVDGGSAALIRELEVRLLN